MLATSATPWHAGELIADEPILHRAQFREIIAALAALCAGSTSQIILVDPAEAGGVRTELRLHAFGHRGLQVVQAFQHAGPGEVGVDAFLER